MKKNEITPLDELRKEKTLLKAQCTKQEEQLLQYWEYVNENIGYILINGLVDAFKRKIGISKDSSRKTKGEPQETGSSVLNGLMSNLKGNWQNIYPMIWEITQPFLWDFALKKFKSLFKSKKKRSKYYDDDED